MPDVDLIVGDLLLLADGGGDLPGDLRRAFQRAVLGHVEDDLQLALVVEGQHLHDHVPSRRNEGHGSEEEDAIPPRNDQRQTDRPTSGT